MTGGTPMDWKPPSFDSMIWPTRPPWLISRPHDRRVNWIWRVHVVSQICCIFHLIHLIDFSLFGMMIHISEIFGDGLRHPTSHRFPIVGLFRDNDLAIAWSVWEWSRITRRHKGFWRIISHRPPDVHSRFSGKKVCNIQTHSIRSVGSQNIAETKDPHGKFALRSKIQYG